MDLLRLFMGASTGTPVQAGAAGNLVADTGPPDFGGPPLFVDGLQKEVTATEPKPQAQTLDLLETLKPHDRKSGKNTNISDLHAFSAWVSGLQLQFEAPDYSDALKSLGIEVPQGFDGQSKDQFQAAVSKTVIDKSLPKEARNFVGLLLSSPIVDRSLSADVPKHDLRLNSQAPQIRTSSGPIGPPINVFQFSDPRPIGPPEQVGSFGLPRPVGPPVAVGGAITGAVVGPPIDASTLVTPAPVGPPVQVSEGLVANVVGPPESVVPPVPPAPVGPPEQVKSDPRTVRSNDELRKKPEDARAGGLTTTAKRQGHGLGLIDKQIVEGLRAVSVSVTESKELSLSSFARVENQALTSVASLPAVQSAPKNEKGAPILSTSEVEAVVGREVPIKSVTQRPDAETEEAFASLDAEVVQPDIEFGSDASAEDVAGFRIDSKDLQRTNPANDLQVRSLSPKDAAAVREQVIEQIQELVATRGNTRVTIKLNPEALGTLTIAVTALNENVEAKVTASNESVRHALHTQRADLVQSVESKGLTLNSFTVGSEANSDMFGGSSDTRHDAQHARQDSSQSVGAWSPKEDAAVTTVASYDRLTSAGVDTLA